MTERSSAVDAFYVGYMKTPKPIRRFVQCIVAAILGFSLGAAAGIVASQEAPGPGVYEFGIDTTIEGTLFASPVPLLVAEDADGSARPILLVDFRKFGADERVEPFDGQRVRLTGWRIHRNGVEMLELLPEPEAIETLAEHGDAASPWRTVGEASLVGEVVDTKCFLGAMKPGAGVVHRGCATLCIQGGVPAGLLQRFPDRAEVTILVSADESVQPRDFVLPLVAERVRADGTLLEVAGTPLRALEIGPADIALSR